MCNAPLGEDGIRPARPLRVPPVAVLAAAGVAQHLLARGRWPSRMSGAAGAFMLVCAVRLLLGGVRSFRRHGTTIDPLDPARASSLVVDGPNAVTRNPMYIGMAALLLAHAVARRSMSGLVPLAGFVIWVDRFQIPQEEVALEASFGAEYRRYAGRVPRWLGVPSQ